MFNCIFNIVTAQRNVLYKNAYYILTATYVRQQYEGKAFFRFHDKMVMRTRHDANCLRALPTVNIIYMNPRRLTNLLSAYKARTNRYTYTKRSSRYIAFRPPRYAAYKSACKTVYIPHAALGCRRNCRISRGRRTTTRCN